MAKNSSHTTELDERRAAPTAATADDVLGGGSGALGEQHAASGDDELAGRRRGSRRCPARRAERIVGWRCDPARHCGEGADQRERPLALDHQVHALRVHPDLEVEVRRRERDPRDDDERGDLPGDALDEPRRAAERDEAGLLDQLRDRRDRGAQAERRGASTSVTNARTVPNRRLHEPPRSGAVPRTKPTPLGDDRRGHQRCERHERGARPGTSEDQRAARASPDESRTSAQRAEHHPRVADHPGEHERREPASTPRRHVPRRSPADRLARRSTSTVR